MKIKLFSAFLATLISFVSASTTLKFATLAPKSSSWGKCLSSIRKDVYKNSSKKVIIKVYYGGQLGDEAEMAKQIQYKQLDGAAFTGNGLGEMCSASRVLEVPNLFRSAAEVDYVYERIHTDLNNHFIKKGYYLISLSETGFAYFFSKRNIQNIEDIRKTKMWMWKGDELAYQLMKTFKIPAQPINFTEVVSTLQTGTIDGFYCTPTAAVSLQWHNESKYMLDLPIANVSGGIVISKASWDKLGAAEKKIIQEASDKHVKILIRANRASDKKTIDLMRGQGIKIIKNNQDKAAWAKMSSGTAEALSGKLFAPELLDKVNALLKEYRSK